MEQIENDGSDFKLDARQVAQRKARSSLRSLLLPAHSFQVCHRLARPECPAQRPPCTPRRAHSPSARRIQDNPRRRSHEGRRCSPYVPRFSPFSLLIPASLCIQPLTTFHRRRRRQRQPSPPAALICHRRTTHYRTDPVRTRVRAQPRSRRPHLPHRTRSPRTDPPLHTRSRQTRRAAPPVSSPPRRH